MLQTIAASDPDQWEKVNMLAPMRLMRCLTPTIVEKVKHVIINIEVCKQARMLTVYDN